MSLSYYKLCKLIDVITDVLGFILIFQYLMSFSDISMCRILSRLSNMNLNDC